MSAAVGDNDSPTGCRSFGVRRRLVVTGATRDGLPVLEDERVLPVENVIWCTGFRPDFSWIDLPVFDGQDKEPKEPIHVRGIVADEPGLYFVGLAFLYAMSSGFLPGVGRDAEHVVRHLASRARASRANSSLQSGRYVADPTRQREVFGQVPTAEDAIARFVGSLGHTVTAC